MGFLLTLTTIASAETHSYNSSSNNASPHSEMNQSQSPVREITPMAGPRIAHGADIFFTADYIYWKTGISFPAAFALTAENAPPLIAGTIGKLDEVTFMDFNWASGFKVGAGINLPHDGWDLAAEYTWLRPRGTERAHLPQAGSGPTGSGFCNNVHVIAYNNTYRAQLDFNNIDLALGRNFYVSRYFTIRPSAGLKGTWQTYDFSLTFAGDHGEHAQGFPFSPVFASASPAWLEFDKIVCQTKAKFWGIGPRIALDLGLFLTKNFSLYANVAWTGILKSLYERNEIFTVDNLFSPVGTIPFVNNRGNTGKTYYTCHSIQEVELGFKYDCYFSEDQYHLSFQAGWETQVWGDWANLNDHFSDLSLMGLNVKVRFDF